MIDGRKTWVGFAVMVSFGLILTWGGGAYAKQEGHKLKPRSDLPRFFPGLVGLATDQRARLSVTSIVPKPAAGEIPPGPCFVDLSFLNDQGGVIATTRAEVGPGESKFLDIGFLDALGIDPAAGATPRVEIRGAAQGVPSPNPISGNGRTLPPGPCRVSLQVYDLISGKTTVWIGQGNPTSGEPNNDPNDVNK